MENLSATVTNHAHEGSAGSACERDGPLRINIAERVSH